MGLVRNYWVVRKSTPRLTKSSSLALIRPVFTKIQRFKNAKNNMGSCRNSLNGGIRTLVYTFLCKLWHIQMAVSCLLLGLFTPNLGIFSWFYSLFFTTDPDLNQDPASLRCCLYKWSLHFSLPGAHHSLPSP